MNDLSWPNTLEIEPPTPQKAPDRPRRQTVPAGTGKKTHTGPAETQAADPARKKRKVLLVADLFCGAGGSSTGAKRALEALGYEMLLTCVNHWPIAIRSEEHTSELQSLMRISYAVYCLKNTTLLTYHLK